MRPMDANAMPIFDLIFYFVFVFRSQVNAEREHVRRSGCRCEMRLFVKMQHAHRFIAFRARQKPCSIDDLWDKSHFFVANKANKRTHGLKMFFFRLVQQLV